ncbi:hypothetical protein J6590_039202 [Homalodisca vitripennis]|nr:hypothetical protein J6590_039202 [Homalodisca vitripennis]
MNDFLVVAVLECGVNCLTAIVAASTLSPAAIVADLLRPHKGSSQPIDNEWPRLVTPEAMRPDATRVLCVLLLQLLS